MASAISKQLIPEDGQNVELGRRSSRKRLTDRNVRKLRTSLRFDAAVLREPVQNFRVGSIQKRSVERHRLVGFAGDQNEFVAQARIDFGEELFHDVASNVDDAALRQTRRDFTSVARRGIERLEELIRPAENPIG